MLYWLRWIAVFPLAAAAAYFVHFMVLYPSAALFMQVFYEPAGVMTRHFAVGLAGVASGYSFVRTGVKIAPDNKIKCAMVLMYMIFFIVGGTVYGGGRYNLWYPIFNGLCALVGAFWGMRHCSRAVTAQ